MGTLEKDIGEEESEPMESVRPSMIYMAEAVKNGKEKTLGAR